MSLERTVRASSLSGYTDCPRRWAARQYPGALQEAGYTLKRLGRHIGSATGQATHQGALSGLRSRIKTGSFDAEEMDDIAIATLRDETANEVIWDDRSPNLNTAEQQVLRQVGVCRDSVLPNDDSEWVEPEWNGVHHTGITLTGHPDAGNYSMIKDLKTGMESDNAAQFGAYIMLSWNAPQLVQIDEAIELFIPRGRITEAAPQLETIKYDVDGCVELADRILVMISMAIDDFDTVGRIAFPTNTRSMLCSNTFCPAHGTSFCPESTLSKR